ncbi:MAG: hypothetical protein F6K24_49280 [Okeania sp. SIO2D1]|nr:hypothetical protein [Okeania sp. SIO2D1]
MSHFKNLSLAITSTSILTTGIVLLPQQQLNASTITFEADMNVPGYVPQDELLISDQFASTFGVTFGLDIDGDGFADEGAFPKLEQAGIYPGDLAGFQSTVGWDIAKPGLEKQLGQFFLKGQDLSINHSNPLTGTKSRNLIINYINPVAGASTNFESNFP